MKLKFQLDYNPEGDSLVTLFNIPEEDIKRIGQFVDRELANGVITMHELMNRCVEKYKKDSNDLFVALCLVWSLWMREAVFQAQLMEAVAFGRAGQMPREVQ